MTEAKIVDEQEPSSSSRVEEAGLYDDNELRNQVRLDGQLRREQAFLDSFGRWVKYGLNVTGAVLLAGIISAALILIGVFVVYAFHLTAPDHLLWMKDDQLGDLATWYGSVTKIAFPVLLLFNPWAVYLSRRMFFNSKRDE